MYFQRAGNPSFSGITFAHWCCRCMHTVFEMNFLTPMTSRDIFLSSTCKILGYRVQPRDNEQPPGNMSITRLLLNCLAKPLIIEPPCGIADTAIKILCKRHVLDWTFGLP